MGYAIRKDSRGWRAVNVKDDVGTDELFSKDRPEVIESACELCARFSSAIQKHLDEFAKTRGYDSIISACTYADSTIPAFKAEGVYAVSARDATWVTGCEILNAVNDGTRAAPTVEELIAELPALAWPK